MKHPAWPRALTEEQAHLLEAYTRILETRAVALGFIAERDRARIFERHVLDSCRALRCLSSAAEVVVDIGSGAGLPGIPVAIALPRLEVVLVEPRRRRAAFLEVVVTELGLPNVRVLAARAQDSGMSADAAMTRAVGDAVTSWSLARPLLTAEGCLVYFAGSSWSDRDVARLGATGAAVTVCDPPRPGESGPLVKVSAAVQGSSADPVAGAD